MCTHITATHTGPLVCLGNRQCIGAAPVTAGAPRCAIALAEGSHAACGDQQACAVHHRHAPPPSPAPWPSPFLVLAIQPKGPYFGFNGNYRLDLD